MSQDKHSHNRMEVSTTQSEIPVAIIQIMSMIDGIQKLRSGIRLNSVCINLNHQNPAPDIPNTKSVASDSYIVGFGSFCAGKSSCGG